MRRAVIVVCSALAGLCAINAASADERAIKEAAMLSVKSGDMIVQQREGMWTAVKVLAVDNWAAGAQAAHCMSYEAHNDQANPGKSNGGKYIFGMSQLMRGPSVTVGKSSATNRLQRASWLVFTST